jgi:hypothetical protein
VAPPPETLFPMATPSPTRDPHYIYAEDFKNIAPYEKLQAELGNPIGFIVKNWASEIALISR